MVSPVGRAGRPRPAPLHRRPPTGRAADPEAQREVATSACHRGRRAAPAWVERLPDGRIGVATSGADVAIVGPLGERSWVMEHAVSAFGVIVNVDGFPLDALVAHIRRI